MSTLREIRRRLKSVENVKKITDAMERVAGARLRRAQISLENARPYAIKMHEMVQHLAAATEFVHPLFEKRVIKKTGLIVISADKGLSGSYNSKILDSTEKFLKKHSKETVDLFLFGKKAIDYFQRRDWSIESKITNWAGKITLQEIEAFTNQLIDGYSLGKYDEVWLIYTDYVSISTRKIVVKKFLNFEKVDSEKLNKVPDYIYEPSADEILSKLLPLYCSIGLQEALYESYASELGARIMAMQMASKNSEEVMESLTKVRNKMRQEGITREMIEIASGVQ
jgi:F-type H+-transporting ATPase subunit gamma